MGRTSKRDDVLDKAEELFEKNGFVATGVNQITEEAGVASMTLYNNFKNKEDLIVATLERRSQRFCEAREAQLRDKTQPAQERILASFDALKDWISAEVARQGSFNGCSFVKAAIEFAAPSHSVHKVAADHKLHLVRLFEEAAQDMGHVTPEELALELHILFDGAITQAQIFGDAGSAVRARRMAERLLGSTP